MDTVFLNRLHFPQLSPYLFYFSAVLERDSGLPYRSAIFLRGTVNEQNRCTAILVQCKKNPAYHL